MLSSNLSTVKPKTFFMYVVRQGETGELDKYKYLAVSIQ
jgi:hypothetical protein